jgi:3',5'-cyclic AMP phosphodiesterase CpdA
MKFAILSDIHLWPTGGTRNGIVRRLNHNVITMLDEFLEKVKTIQPEFLVVLWDLIEHESKEKDKEHLAYLYKRFQDLPFPVYYVR